MNFKPIVPDGQHLGESHSHPGAYNGLLFDDETGNLVGHAAWEWVDEDDAYHYDSDPAPHYEQNPAPRPLTEEEMELAIQMITLVVIGITEAAVQLMPHLKRLWKRVIVPGAARLSHRLRTFLRSRSFSPETDRFEPLMEDPREEDSTPTSRNSTGGADLVVFEPSFEMAESEWLSRYRAMILAARFSREQEKILMEATIVEDSKAGLKSNSLTPKQFAQLLATKIASHPEILTVEVLEALRYSMKSTQSPSTKAFIRRAGK